VGIEWVIVLWRSGDGEEGGRTYVENLEAGAVHVHQEALMVFGGVEDRVRRIVGKRDLGVVCILEYHGSLYRFFFLTIPRF